LTSKNITTPDLGGATDVTVIEVLVKAGDRITADTSVVTLESDKATMDIPAGEAGVVKELKVKVGDKVSAGNVMLVLESEGAEAKPAPAKAEAKQAEKTPAPKQEPAPAPAAKPAAQPATTPAPAPFIPTGDVHAGPGVRRLARELGVNLTLVGGTGPKQRIMKEDVFLFVKTQLSQLAGGGVASAFPPAPVVDFAKFGPIENQALSRIKKISGKNLQRNWATIPHVTQFGEADMSLVNEFREEQKEELAKQQVKLTPLVFVMKAVVASLRAFPHFNASLDASGENLILKKYFHLGVAVDTPDGLVVPVIRDVDQKGYIDLAKELAVVSDKARKKQLTPGDMQGGCFTISSLGGIGGTAFTPIINAPEVAILGVSKSVVRPVYVDGALVPRMMLPLSLSYDHRVIDGADGARFIVHLANMLTDIRNMLL
jgi:pyruvate dehydrogenase E2 component (dihydrolipoamide acetyltransferase)